MGVSAENLLTELNGKSWKSLEAEFNQLIQNEDSDTQMATLFSFQKMAKMDPEELGQLTMDAMHKDQSAELEQMYAAPKAKSCSSNNKSCSSCRSLGRPCRPCCRWCHRQCCQEAGRLFEASCSQALSQGPEEGRQEGPQVRQEARHKVLYQTVYQSCRQGLPPGRWFPCCRCCGCRHRRRL